MDSILIDNMWKVTKPEDTIYTVGDFAFWPSAKDPDWLRTIFDQLHEAEQHLVVGNHDLRPTQALLWTSVTHMTEVEDRGKSNVLCHYPMITWNRARKGALQVFGHVHNSWLGSRNAVNVGVDAWDYMPATMRDIERRARKLPVNQHRADVERGVKIDAN